jgi:hypothetical protein
MAKIHQQQHQGMMKMAKAMTQDELVMIEQIANETGIHTY